MSDPVLRVMFTKIAKANAASQAPNVKIITQKNILIILEEELTTPQ